MSAGRQVIVSIRTEGAAFRGDRFDTEDDSLNRDEVARLLREAADKIEGGSDHGALVDYNGNGTGGFSVDERGA